MLILHVTLCMGETFLASLADYCGQNTEVSDGLKSRVTLPFRLDIELEILSLALSVVKRRKSPPSTQSITLPPLSCHIVPSLQLSKVVRKKGGRVLRQEKVALRDKLFICEQAGRLPASLPLMTLLPPSSVQRFPSSPFLPPSSPHFSKRWTVEFLSSESQQASAHVLLLSLSIEDTYRVERKVSPKISDPCSVWRTGGLCIGCLGYRQRRKGGKFETNWSFLHDPPGGCVVVSRKPRKRQRKVTHHETAHNAIICRAT